DDFDFEGGVPLRLVLPELAVRIDDVRQAPERGHVAGALLELERRVRQLILRAEVEDERPFVSLRHLKPRRIVIVAFAVELRPHVVDELAVLPDAAHTTDRSLTESDSECLEIVVRRDLLSRPAFAADLLGR